MDIKIIIFAKNKHSQKVCYKKYKFFNYYNSKIIFSNKKSIWLKM